VIRDKQHLVESAAKLIDLLEGLGCISWDAWEGCMERLTSVQVDLWFRDGGSIFRGKL
jgi:hypothetical protein